MPLKSIYRAPWFVKVVFVVSLFIVFFIAGVSYKHITDLSKSQELVVQTYKVNVELEQILSYLKDAETGQRGYFITQDSLYLQPFLESRSKINNSFAELKSLTKDNPVQQKNLKELNVLIENRLENFDLVSAYTANDEHTELQFKMIFLNGKNIMDSIRVKLNGMIALEEKILKERQDVYKSDMKFTPVFLYSLIVLTLLLMYAAYAKISSNVDKLKRSNQRLEIFKEATKQSEIINKHGSWRWEVEEDKFHFSDNLFRLLGEKPQSFDHTLENFMRYVHPEDIDKLSAQVEQMKEDQELPFIYYRVVHADGSVHYLKAYGRSTVNAEGRVQLLGTTTDITDEIDHFNTLEQRNQELELNNKELAAFNYVASHDLQEPLRKIQTFLSRLEEKELEKFSESGKTYMARINVAATRMRSLIDDLLQYSRTNKSDEVLVETTIDSLIEDAQQDLAESIVAEDASIKVDRLPQMKVIPFQIQQLFSNLISNSLKYRSKGRKPEIHISYLKVLASADERLNNAQSDFYHRITFSDNGIGFDQEYAEKIFVLFSRLHNKDEYSGTGIGLSICRKIVDNHGGFIFAAGVPNKGATFTIYLPVS